MGNSPHKYAFFSLVNAVQCSKKSFIHCIPHRPSIIIMCHTVHCIFSTSTSYDAPSIVTTMHRLEQTIYLQLINNKNIYKKVTYLHIYKMENCLDVVSLDLWFCIMVYWINTYGLWKDIYPNKITNLGCLSFYIF